LSSFGTCCASANFGFIMSSSITAVTLPIANFAARSRKARRSMCPCT
jgi:hypothetical protein